MDLAFPKTSSRRVEGTRRDADRQNGNHLAWVRKHRCCVKGCTRGPIEAHHVRSAATGGTSIKPPDSATVPLCRFHHTGSADSIHRLGQISFQEEHGINLSEIARAMAIASPFTPD